MELMSESVGILLVLPVSDLVNASVQRNAEKLFISAHLLLIGDAALFVFIITVSFMYLSGF